MNILALPIDILAKTALELNLPDILSLCESNSRFNYAVCEKESFWLNKLNIDYPDFRKYDLKGTYREIYKFIYKYALPKYIKGKEYNILDLYKSVEMGLNSREEFEKFVRQIFPIDNLIVNNEGTNLLDYVFYVEDQLGSYEPLNSGQIVIVFNYDLKEVGFVSTYVAGPPRYYVIWAK